ncbi:MAG: HAD-IC family P-type ATPase, partial [Armatimonadetes bacterium]|nr:HAD-IC family P-type ATPase [Armatimonadota bacterium]
MLPIVAGLAIVALIYWFFFGPRREEAGQVTPEGVQEFTITVSGAYSPSRLVVEPGRPVRLIFDRQETESCSDQVLIPEYGIARDLPPFKQTVVEFTPAEPGDFVFACSMGMYRGTILVAREATGKVDLDIKGMTCAACVSRVEKGLRRVPGVMGASVNLATETAQVAAGAGVTVEKLVGAVERSGYAASPKRATSAERDVERAREARLVGAKFWVALALTLPVLATSMHIPGVPTMPTWLQLALTAPVILWAGRHFFVQAAKALRYRAADMNVLIAIGTGSAFGYSLWRTILAKGGHAEVYYEVAAAIITLILLGRCLEATAKGKTGDAIRKLLELEAKSARVIRNGEELVLPLGDVVKGDIVIVKPGEKIAVDGVISEGSSSIDESMLTGESIPVDKVPGHQVYAGTLNQQGSFRFEATGVGQETALARIVQMVQQAQG